MDIHTEPGQKKAENLFKELMMKIAAILDSFRSQPGYVLEQTLDFSTACHQFKVKYPILSPGGLVRCVLDFYKLLASSECSSHAGQMIFCHALFLISCTCEKIY